MIKHSSPSSFRKNTQPSLPRRKQKRGAANKRIPPFDRLLLILVLTLVSIGSVMVFSASFAYAEARYGDSGYFSRKQILFVSLGIVLMLGISFIPPRLFKKSAAPLFLVTVLLLLATLAFGLTGNGAQRWIALGPFTFQPSELAKLSLILTLSSYFSRHSEEEIGSKKGAIRYGILYPFLYIGIICLLVVLQRHLSGLIILSSIGLLLMYAAGSPKKVLGLLCGGGIGGVACLAFLLPYAKERITVWLDPAAYPLEGGWQTLQGLMAIGSGGFFGLGLFKSRMKYSWVSEPANDFIFTITCEELGFIGAFFILLLFFLFIRRAFLIGIKNPDPFCRLAAIGISIKVAVQVLLNIAVVTNAIPNTGISLPFFSYGGSSLLMLFAEMGILLSISRTSLLTYR